MPAPLDIIKGTWRIPGYSRTMLICHRGQEWYSEIAGKQIFIFHFYWNKEENKMKNRVLVRVVASVIAVSSVCTVGFIKSKKVNAAYSVNTVVDIAKNEVGYIEKKSNTSNSNLYLKTGYAGTDNLTKYCYELSDTFYGWNKTAKVAWCDTFVDWCFVKAYGLDAAKKITFQTKNPSAYCQTSMQNYKDNNSFIGRNEGAPQKGDQVFLYDKNGAVNHTGIVVEVNMVTRKVKYVDGNSGEKTDRVSLSEKSLNDSRIAGYGRPNFPGSSSPYIVTCAEQDFVIGLYSKCFNRSASGNEINFWVDMLKKEKNAAKVVYGFIDSQEFKNKNLSNRDYVLALYTIVLGRDGNKDPDGRNYWIKQLNNGTNRTNILKGFLNSSEFKDRCKKLGISAGSV